MIVQDGPNQRCPVCGQDTLKVVEWQMSPKQKPTLMATCWNMDCKLARSSVDPAIYGDPAQLALYGLTPDDVRFEFRNK